MKKNGTYKNNTIIQQNKRPKKLVLHNTSLTCDKLNYEVTTNTIKQTNAGWYPFDYTTTSIHRVQSPPPSLLITTGCRLLKQQAAVTAASRYLEGRLARQKARYTTQTVSPSSIHNIWVVLVRGSIRKCTFFVYVCTAVYYPSTTILLLL